MLLKPFQFSIFRLTIENIFCIYEGSNYDSRGGSETRGLNESSHHQHASSDYKLTPMTTAEQREKYYATIRKPMSEQSPTGNHSLERIPEYSEGIYYDSSVISFNLISIGFQFFLRI